MKILFLKHNEKDALLSITGSYVPRIGEQVDIEGKGIFNVVNVVTKVKDDTITIKVYLY